MTRKGYGRIYVLNEADIPKVKAIIKEMDEFEYDYLPENLVAPWSEYPKLAYTHKFDTLDMNKLTAKCWKQGIMIWVLDNQGAEYLSDPA